MLLANKCDRRMRHLVATLATAHVPGALASAKLKCVEVQCQLVCNRKCGMVMGQKADVRIVEVAKNEAYLSQLKSRYLTSGYYDLSVCRKSGFWKAELALKPFEKVLEKDYQGRLFEDHVVEPRVFVALSGDKQVGWIELGFDKWNNRMRVWEFLVEEAFRRKGIGTALMDQAVKIAEEKRARMLVLETQTCNAPAIDFYVKSGFELIGFDTAAYSNNDVEKKEVRLELGMKLSS